MENKIFNNKLIDEVSPYLLQHAHNPVNWYPWNDEAFNIAKELDRPIFLSIGYSTCHWCHVMAHESFEDEGVSEVLNESFISIKVNREERPDIDSIYMDVAQAMTGSGGWPLTIIMTPDKKPFFAGTYLPKESKYGRMGIIELLEQVKQKWEVEKDILINASEEITKAVIDFNKPNYGNHEDIDKEDIGIGIDTLENRFDKNYGGFGESPKFPTPHNLMFLLQAYSLGLNDNALKIVEKTLDSMYQGGLFDHIGYGFSRYSTDKKWLAPHFEKMLYDNALLVITYSEAYQITKNELYKYIVEKTLEYIEREMTSEEFGFYSAQDADSQGEEGKYYTWNYSEILNILGEEDGKSFCGIYDITPNGNFEGKNILNLIDKEIIIPDEKLTKELEKLYNARFKRYPLHKDDKILTSWNGMMIAAYAIAGRVFNNDEYINIGEKAYEFIKKNMTKENNHLYISYRNGKKSGEGLLDDYAYIMWGALELYGSTFNSMYLEEFLIYYNIVVENFSDNGNGYYLTPKTNTDLIYKPKEFYDGAVLSGNSILAYLLVRFSKLTGNMDITKESDNQLRSFSKNIKEQPTSATFALKAVLLNLYDTWELVSVLKNGKIKEVVSKLSEIYLPELNNIIITEENKKNIENIATFTKEYSKNIDGDTFYLCKNYSCMMPVYSIEEVISKIK